MPAKTLLFVAKDMELARVRCHVWQAGGYNARAVDLATATSWAGDAPDVLVISYHFDPQGPESKALAGKFPNSRTVHLPRGVVGRELMKAVSA